MKSETRFAINTALLIIATLVFNILAFDWSRLNPNAKSIIVRFIKDYFDEIQFHWCLHLCGIAIITIIATLFKIKKNVNLWEYSCKIMWLAFLAVILIHSGGIVIGW